MGGRLNLGLVADIHHGVHAGTKVGPAALPLLRDFADWANGHALDLVVELGDRINNEDAVRDFALTRDIAAAFHAVKHRRAHILGNHDNHDLDRSQAEDAMQLPFASTSLDLNGFHLVFWNANTAVKGRRALDFDPADLDWLAADLAGTELPTVIFTHVPLDQGSMVGNYYFEEALKGFGHYASAAAARAVIERSGRVILCVAGHTHWNALNTIDGIHYVTVHSLTESFTTWPHPTGAWALLQLGEHIELEVFGRDPAWYRLPIRPRNRHWASLSRPYAPAPEGARERFAARLAAHRAEAGGGA